MDELQRRIEGRSCPEPNTGCWLWLRYTAPDGYGRMSWRGRLTTAHRLAYEVFCGPIPKGLVIDHLCRTRCCVNPCHLQVVTDRVNVVVRGRGHAARNARKTHCKRGHALRGDNLVMKGRWRTCRACQRMHNRRQQENRRARRAR